MTEMRPVPGYEGLYSVTRDGRVWAHRSGRWLKFDETQGYLRAPLCRKCKTRFIKVHRLVALVWVPNPQGRPEINHLDGDRHNNRDSNLEWVNRSENMLHHFRLRRRPRQGAPA